MTRKTHQALVAMASVLLFASSALATNQEQRSDPLFVGDIADFVWTLLIFILTLLVLRKFAWRPLLDILQRRENLIRDSMETAVRNQEAAAAQLQEYERKLSQARQEASALVEEGRRDAEVVRRRVDEEARRNAEALIDRAQREIRMARDSALRDLYDQSAHLATDLAGQILQRQLSEEDQRQLIEEALRQMDGQPDNLRGAAGNN